MKTALLAALALTAVLPAPAFAQSRDRVLVIYGDEKCPTSNGEEIVVCVRKPASEQFRIPEELRSSGEGLQPSWSEKAKSIEYVGASGTGSCTPAGHGAGFTGCLKQMIDAAKEERRAASAGDRSPR